jgi:hypothetical protein
VNERNKVQAGGFRFGSCFVVDASQGKVQVNAAADCEDEGGKHTRDQSGATEDKLVC